jgi:hypothetical protein
MLRRLALAYSDAVRRLSLAVERLVTRRRA